MIWNVAVCKVGRKTIDRSKGYPTWYPSQLSKFMNCNLLNPISMALKTLLAEKQRKERSIEKKIKRKGSLLDRFFPKVKRARRTESNSTKMTKVITDNKKKSKPSLDKSRRKEVKRRLNEEANKEIVPLAVGTLAMMGSALSNQGKYM